MWPGGKATTGGGNDSDTIHVFSLASGHLYERFLKIMMLTVTRNTKSPVKFWLLANFLSPKFKVFYKTSRYLPLGFHSTYGQTIQL